MVTSPEPMVIIFVFHQIRNILLAGLAILIYGILKPEK